MHEETKLVDRFASIYVTESCEGKTTNNNSKQERCAHHSDFPLNLTNKIKLLDQVVNRLRIIPVDLACVFARTILFLERRDDLIVP